MRGRFFCYWVIYKTKNENSSLDWTHSLITCIFLILVLIHQSDLWKKYYNFIKLLVSRAWKLEFLNLVAITFVFAWKLMILKIYKRFFRGFKRFSKVLWKWFARHTFLGKETEKLSYRCRVLKSIKCCCCFFIRVFFLDTDDSQESKERGPFFIPLTTPTCSRTLRHLFATLHVRWLSPIFNCNACDYHTAIRWDLPPPRITIWLIDDYAMFVCLLDELILGFCYSDLTWETLGFELLYYKWPD